MPSEITFRRVFGSWSNALRAAGFEPVKFIPTLNGITRKGTRNKNRKEVINDGYLSVFEPTHPAAGRNGYVRVNRMVAYDAGLLTDLADEVHHRNQNKLDNRLDNLEVLSKAGHATITTPKGSKRPRRQTVRCFYPECATETGSKYGLCVPHYKLQWDRVKRGLIKDVLEVKEISRAHSEKTKQLLRRLAKKQMRRGGRFVK